MILNPFFFVEIVLLETCQTASDVGFDGGLDSFFEEFEDLLNFEIGDGFGELDNDAL